MKIFQKVLIIFVNFLPPKKWSTKTFMATIVDPALKLITKIAEHQVAVVISTPTINYLNSKKFLFLNLLSITTRVGSFSVNETYTVR